MPAPVLHCAGRLLPHPDAAGVDPRWEGPLIRTETLVIGVEIGGRGQRVVIVDGSGHVRARARAIDSALPGPAAVQTVRALIDQSCVSAGVSLEQVRRVGVAFGGPVDAERGLTIMSHRAGGFDDFPLGSLLEEHLHLPVAIDNSSRCAALGEAWYGAGRGSRDLLYLHLGTGVGAGMIIAGRLVRGATGTAGEIGHMVVSSSGPICSCGKPGHLEAYASAPAILSRYRERVQSAESDGMAARGTAALTVRGIFASAGEGDQFAAEVVEETVQMLGLAAANLLTALNPNSLVIGGAVAEAGTVLLDRLGARVRQYGYPPAVRRTRLALGQLGVDATILGAAALALHGSSDAAPEGAGSRTGERQES